MLKLLVSFTVFITFVFSGGSAAAQSEPTTPLGDADDGWCTVAQGTDGIYQQCGFGGPGAACSFQGSTFYPLGRITYNGATMRDENIAACNTVTNLGPPEELVKGVAAVVRRCGAGSARIGSVCKMLDSTSNCRDEKCDTKQIGNQAGNPINVLTGAKVQDFTDYASSDGRFMVQRHYNSLPFTTPTQGWLTASQNMGNSWMMSFDMILKLDDDRLQNGPISILAPDGFSERVDMSRLDYDRRYNKFYAGGIGLQYELVVEDKISAETGASYTQITAIKLDGIRYKFNLNETSARGDSLRPVSVDYPGDYSQSYTYLDNGRLESISDSFGRTMSISYHESVFTRVNPDTGETEVVCLEKGRDENDNEVCISVREPVTTRIKNITFPDGSRIDYAYDAIDAFDIDWNLATRLKSVTRYDANGILDTSESYHYEDERYSFALTGITDSEGVRYATWSYDGYGRAISSAHPDDVDATLVDYNGIDPRSGRSLTRTVTNALGHTTTYNADSVRGGNYFMTEAVEASGSGVESSQKSMTDSGGEPDLVTDREGNQFRYQYDLRGRPTSVIRAVGTPEESISTATWHTIYRIPTQVVQPGLTTDVTIEDSTGHVLSMTQTDTSPQGNAPRTWAFTYEGPNLTSIDGPLAGTGDIQTFVYEGPNLTLFTNEVGHTTTITEHNLVGAPALFTDANGITTRLVYDGDNRLTNIIEDDGGINATTSITYNKTDQILSVTPPNGASLIFTYDDARRLETITNAVGETISYTRNAMGGILETQMSDDSSTMTYQLTQVFDQKNRVMSAIGAGATGSDLNAVTEFGYDREDNLTSIIDPRQNTWTQSFDALDRLESETDPLTATTDYGLSEQTGTQNPLTSVTDARGATTNYIRNGYGEVIREVSFEAGTTNYLRDTRGLTTQMTDARSVATNYTYDDMGRLLTVSYPSEPESDIAYAYDEGPNGVGQLTTVTEDYGVTSYSYNTLGHMIAMTRTINGQSYTIKCTYDLAGEVLTTTYPSGRVVTHTRDAAARTSDLSLSGDINADILADVTYLPFGPMTGARFGDGHDLSLTYDSSYRATTLKRQMILTSIMDIEFEYDAAGDILALYDNVNNDRSQRFEYSDVSRLTRAEGVYGDIDYTYNLVGDRETRMRQRVSGDGSLEFITEDYSYDPSTFQLTEVSVGATIERVFGYAPSGQITRDDRNGQGGFDYTFENDARGRLAHVRQNGSLVASYLYDADEQRIAKTTAEGTVHYHYDLEGRLISETSGETGHTIREYLWLDLSPVAVIASRGEGGLPDGCDPDELESIEGLLSARESTLATIRAQVDVLVQTRETRVNTLGTVTARRTRLQGILDGINPSNTDRIADITSRIASDDVRIADLNANIESLDERLAYYAERDEYLSGRVTALTLRVELLVQDCAGANDNSPSAELYYLHTDHLGRPKVATDTDGTIVWDGGLTTPFGQGITTMGAITQKLMFPGQYEDEETGYSHNWHRTYDPTLGRYLQADPIGLAGGLNRYAYVGGNPTSWVDPEGLQQMPSPSGMSSGVGPSIPSFPRGAAFAQAGSISANAFMTPRSRHPLGATYAGGVALGAYGAAAYYEYLNYIWNPDGGMCAIPLVLNNDNPGAGRRGGAATGGNPHKGKPAKKGSPKGNKHSKTRSGTKTKQRHAPNWHQR